MGRVRAAVAGRAVFHLSTHLSSSAVRVTIPVPVPSPLYLYPVGRIEVHTSPMSMVTDHTLWITWRCMVCDRDQRDTHLEVRHDDRRLR